MTAHQIALETAHKHGLTLAQVTSDSRCRTCSNARSEAMYRIRTERKLSLHGIGRIFNRTHTSVMYQIRKWEKEIAA